MKKKLLALALLSVAGVAKATNWAVVYSDSASTAYISTDRIRPHDGMIDIWEKVVFNSPQHAGTVSYNWTMAQYSVRCSDRAMRQNALNAYDSDGTTVASNPDVGPWKPVIPDSIADGFVTKVCGG